MPAPPRRPCVGAGYADPVEPAGATGSFHFPNELPGYFAGPAAAAPGMGANLLEPTVAALAEVIVAVNDPPMSVGRRPVL